MTILHRVTAAERRLSASIRVNKITMLAAADELQARHDVADGESVPGSRAPSASRLGIELPRGGCADGAEGRQ